MAHTKLCVLVHKDRFLFMNVGDESKWCKSSHVPHYKKMAHCHTCVMCGWIINDR
jgi:hypothetical protein